MKETQKEDSMQDRSDWTIRKAKISPSTTVRHRALFNRDAKFTAKSLDFSLKIRAEDAKARVRRDQRKIMESLNHNTVLDRLTARFRLPLANRPSDQETTTPVNHLI
jgi:hypothetical protein